MLRHECRLSTEIVIPPEIYCCASYRYAVNLYSVMCDPAKQE